MKKILFCLMVVSLVVPFFTGCGDDPDPRFRVTNNYTDTVNISYKVGDGNTVNMNGVATNTTSIWKTVPETTVTVTGFPAEKAGTQAAMAFKTEKGYQYTVVVAAAGTATVNKEDQ